MQSKLWCASQILKVLVRTLIYMFLDLFPCIVMLW